MILITVRDGMITYIGTNESKLEDVKVTILDYDLPENSTNDWPVLDPAYVNAKLEDFKEDNPDTSI